MRKIILSSLGFVAAAILLAVAAVYALSERQLRRVYAVPDYSIAIPDDSLALARGRYVVQSLGTCATCHDTDFGGKVYADIPALGVIAGPNLTRGAGGRGAELTDDDWIRAIRFGVHRDGTSMIVMPSEVFMAMSDRDLGAAIAYLRTLPPVDRTVPKTHFRILGRALLAAGKMKILTAPKTPATASVAAVPPGPTIEYGRYLVQVAGCAGCHGHGLSGGRVAGPSSLPPASNLTPTGIGNWTEADLRRVLREGKKPDGAPIDSFMPTRSYAGMTDEDIHAIWLYLRSVPPKPFGNK